MFATIYCRVSTSAQAEEGTSLASQCEACVRWAAEHGYLVKDDFVFLEDWSGADLDRPKLDRVRELIKIGTAQALICYAVDRLARDPIHIGIIAEECAKRGAELLFVQEPLDSSPEGALIRYVKGYAAQIERERIKERTLRGKRSRARMGFMVQGTGKGIYGYRYIPEQKRRLVDDLEAQVIRRIFEACISRESCYMIATKLNRDGICAFGGGLWHPLTIKRILTNPAYKGTTFFGRTRRVRLNGSRRLLEERRPEDWIEIPNVTPAIISEAIFDMAQEALRRPKRQIGSESRKYLLTSHFECECGAPVVGTTLNQTYHYYRCRSTWPTTTRPKTCDAKYIRADMMEEKVWRAIREVLQRPELVIQEINAQQGDRVVVEEEIDRTRGLIKRLDDQERRLIRLFGMARVTEEHLVSEIERVKKARAGLDEKLAHLRAQQEKLHRTTGLSEEVRAFCAHVASQLDEFDFEKKRLALQALQIKLVAGHERATLFGIIPTNLATIEQTSA